MWPVMAGQILRIKASARGNHPGAIPVGPGGGIVGRAGIEERHLPTGWMDTACDRDPRICVAPTAEGFRPDVDPYRRFSPGPDGYTSRPVSTIPGGIGFCSRVAPNGTSGVPLDSWPPNIWGTEGPWMTVRKRIHEQGRGLEYPGLDWEGPWRAFSDRGRMA